MKAKHLLTLTIMLLGISLTAMGQTDLSGDQAKNGTFYLMNVSSGKYLKFGGAYNAKAAEGNAGTPITLARSGNGYTLKTNAGYLDSDLMMTGAAFEWTLTKVDGVNQYYLKASDGRGVLTTKGNAYGLLGLASYNPDDNKQKWVLLTSATIKSMTKNAVNTFNATPLIQAASFDKNENINAWSNLNANNIITINESNDAAEYGAVISGNSVTISQTLTGLSQGTYKISFDALYNATSGTAQVDIKAKNSNVTIDITRDETLNSNNQEEILSGFRTNDHCKHSTVFTFNGNNASITINITLQGQNVIACIDNLALYFVKEKGADEEEVNGQLQQEYTNSLNSYIEETQTKVDALNEAGQEAYDISAVIADRDAGNINSDETLQAAIAAIDAAYETALDAHNQKELEDLIGSGGGEGGEGGEVEVDVTDLFIKNAGFGTGDDRYWTINGAIISTSGIAVSGATGSYLFRGTSIKQDVALTDGKYKLTAKVASTNGTTVTLTANEGRLTEESTTLQTTNTMTEITLEKVIAYDGMLLIQVTGEAEFYLDDFALSYQEALPDDPQLQETVNMDAGADFYPVITVARTLKANTWSTFVVPFNMEIPEGWEVKELASSTMNGESITLTFEDAASIEAGIPYMVRLTEAASTLTVTNVWLDAELKPVSTDHVNFVGVYTNGYVPIGSYFISSNKFYRSVNEDNRDTLKGFRAYIEPKEGSGGAKARSLGYRFASNEEKNGEGTTAIEGQQPTEAPTVAAIYTLGGVRIDDMQQGVNIVLMSDGSTMKVIIK
ncbi:MAG: hypothetical protein IKJ18_01410 [Bacteroidaceae bacterium]|nr:hypothetical protein [Bacteroidaceae bacterium]